MKNEQLPASVINDARAIDLVLLAESYGVKMAKQGKDFFGLCPFHSEDSPSFTIFRKDSGPQRFQCFGCGASGDTIEFVQSFEGLKFRDAVRRLVGNLPATGNAPTPSAEHVPVEPEEVWTPALPIPDTAPMTPDTIRRKIKGQWVAVKASRRWDYRDANGDVLGYVFRFDMPGGGKEVLPLVWAVSSLTGEMQWRWISFPKPRPLYGLDKLSENPNAQVLVVEGEKAADAAQELFVGLGVPMSKLVVVSWPGGGKAIKHVDFGALAGRSVALWPDADQKPYPANHERAGVTMQFLEQPGTVAMLDAWVAIRETAASVKFVMPPEGVPDGWDLADPPPSGFSLLAHIKSSTVDPVTLVQANDPAEPVRPIDPVKPEAPAPKPDVLGDDGDDGEDVQSDGYFAILGYNRGTYYVLNQRMRQITELKKGDLTDTGLIELAPISWWEMSFRGKDGFAKKAAINWFISRAMSKGIYDPARTRGRGAWIDQCRVVLHLGNALYVDGVKTDVTKIASRYVYELDRALPDIAPTALSADEGQRLLGISKMFRWTKPASAPLLAGWVALAPLCGAMKWRPHIWITGGAGCGKTTCLNDYVHQLVNGMCLFAQGNSSEAGIRQALKIDALPVLFDESESNEEKDRLRIQSVLSMIRQASSESAAQTYKGTAFGDSMNFYVRSMFALSSIQVALKHQADLERLAVLSLRPKSDDPHGTASSQWAALEAELAKIKADETLPARLFRRSVDLLPVTMQNIGVFVRAAADKFGSQRDGDQYGTLMAGAWSLQSDALATPKQAREMLDAYDWDDHMEHSETDESQMALGALMGAMVSLQGGSKCTVHELVMLACSRAVPGAPDIGATEAGAALKRLGLKIDGPELLLSNRMVPALEEIMRHSQFAADLRGQLLRLPGARRCTKVTRFAGVIGRGYAIPLQPLLDESVPVSSGEPAPPPF